MIREKIIKKIVFGKDVLDVGGVGQNPEYSLWHHLKSFAGSLTGIDVIPSDNRNILIGNMEDYSFNKKFDVVVLGDVLEHVDNQGLLLDNVHQHLKLDGRLIITTPNAKWFTVIGRPNPTHLLWHDRFTLKAILEKHGFNIVDLKFYYGNKAGYNIFLRPLILKQQMLAICKMKEDNENR